MAFVAPTFSPHSAFTSQKLKFPLASVPFAEKRRSNVLTCCQIRNHHDSDMPLLEMRNITLQAPMNFDRYIFKKMNFKIYPKQFVVVIGENGAGKSTALSLMTGLTKVDKGEGDLYWMGVKTKPSQMLKKIGIVMQNPSTYFITRTVLDELVLGRKTKTPQDVRQVLRATGLTNISLLSNPKSLSGGQIRRLAIASQLMRSPLPALFVMDEPLAGVDWTNRRELIQLFGSLKSQFAIIVVSHEPGELLQYADRVVEVSRGGMHDINPQIIKKAIEVRAQKRAEKKEKALKDAALYRQRKSFEAEVDNIVR